jgi:hypothetical protein
LGWAGQLAVPTTPACSVPQLLHVGLLAITSVHALPIPYRRRDERCRSRHARVLEPALSAMGRAPSCVDVELTSRTQRSCPLDSSCACCSIRADVSDPIEPLGKGVAQMTRCLHLADTTSDIAAVGCFLVCRCILQDFNRIQVTLNEVKMEKITLEDELKRARQGGHNPPRTPSRVGATRTFWGYLLVVPSSFGGGGDGGDAVISVLAVARATAAMLTEAVVSVVAVVVSFSSHIDLDHATHRTLTPATHRALTPTTHSLPRAAADTFKNMHSSHRHTFIPLRSRRHFQEHAQRDAEGVEEGGEDHWEEQEAQGDKDNGRHPLRRSR